MITIAIIGDGDDLAPALFLRLSEDFSLTSIKDGEILQSAGNGGIEILIAEMPYLKTFDASSMLAIIKKGSKPPFFGEMPKGLAVIVHSEDARLLSGGLLSPIICGNGAKDTVSFSSKDEDSVVVTLQRAVESFCGNAVEPFELPLTKGCEDDYSLLVYAAVCAVIGYVNGDKL